MNGARCPGLPRPAAVTKLAALAVATAGRWPSRELGALLGYLRTEILRQVADEELLLFPARRPDAGLARLAATMPGHRGHGDRSLPGGRHSGRHGADPANDPPPPGRVAAAQQHDPCRARATGRRPRHRLVGRDRGPDPGTYRPRRASRPRDPRDRDAAPRRSGRITSCRTPADQAVTASRLLRPAGSAPLVLCHQPRQRGP